MKIAAHPVAPEEVMAYVDGELPDFDAQAVSAHLERCVSCSALADELRETSRSFSAWSVPATSMKLEYLLGDVASTAEKYRNAARGGGHQLNWKRWALAGGTAFAVLTLSSLMYRSVSYRSHRRSMVASTVPAMPGQMIGTGVLGDRPRESPSPVGASVEKTGGDTSGTIVAPMIARTVSLVIQVKDLSASRSSVDGILARHRGYSAQLNVTDLENFPRSFEASLRIPVSELDSALQELRSLGLIENESQSGEEVAQQHADLLARLKTSRETEDRFRGILQQCTGSISDVLKVEQEIARVRGEIERMEAEQKMLEHRVDFATVSLRLSEEYKAQLVAPADAVSTRMHNAFVAGYRHATGTLLGIVLFFEEFGPVLLIWTVLLGLPLILVRRRYRRLHS